MYEKILSGLSFKLRDTKFFNPKTSALKLSLSLSSCTMQIGMAKTLDPSVQPGKIKKGDKQYDWGDGEVYFSCSPEECVHISKNINSLMKGIYENPKSKKQNFPDTFKNAITVEHFKDNVPTTLVVAQSTDKSGSSTGSVKVSIVHPKGKGNSVTYFLRENELKIFLEFCKHCAVDLPFYVSLISGVVKTLKQVNFEYGKDDNNYDNRNNSYKKQEDVKSFDTDDDEEEESVETEDLDFGF